MDTHHFKVSLISVLVMTCLLVPYVAGESIYIVTSPNQPCPSEHAPERCMTLQQYTATKNTSMTDRVTLELQPGTHVVGSSLSFSNTTSFQMYGMNSSILCNQLNSSEFLHFINLEFVSINSITFTSCRMAWIHSVRVLELQSSIFEYHGPVILKDIENATISKSTFLGGHGLRVQSSILQIKQTNFSNLTVDGNGSRCSPYNGAAIWSNNSVINVTQCAFKKNAANCNCSLAGITSCGNKAKRSSRGTASYNNGGVACINGSNVSIFNSIFHHNEASGHAGVLYIDNSVLFTRNSTYRNNSAGGSGGVIYVHTAFSDVNVTIDQCLFESNRAGEDGGVMYVEQHDGHVKVRDTRFFGNHAGRRGGAVAIVGSKLDINNNTTAENNTATTGSVISACMSDVSVPDELVARLDSSCDFSESTATEVSTEPPPSIASTTSNIPPAMSTQNGPSTFDTTPNMPPAMSTQNAPSTVDTIPNMPPATNIINAPTVDTTSNMPPATSTPSTVNTTWNTSITTVTSTTNEVSTKRPPSTAQNTPHITTTGSTDSKNQDVKTSALNESEVTVVTYATLGIAIFMCVLVLVLYIIVICIILYICGVFKAERGANGKVDNPHVYVPLKETNTTTNNDAP